MPASAAPPLPADIATRLTTPLLVLDGGLRMTWLNDAMADLLNVGVRKAVGQAFARLLPDGAETLNGVIARLQEGDAVIHWRAVRLETLEGNEHGVDIAVQALDTDHYLLEIHPLAESASSPAPLAATLRGVAHELKNPLTGMRGAAQLICQRVDDDQTQQLARMVIEESDRLTALANRWLTHGGAAQLQQLSLYPLLERVRRLCADQVSAIAEDYDPSLPEIYADPDRLQQLLLNLMVNAIEAGAGHLRLRTRIAYGVILPAGLAPSVVRVDVIDDGPGVPEGLRDHLFEPMVTGRADGSGLGLALALETARDHGGDLRHAHTGDGTVFSLYLPLRHLGECRL